MSASAERPIRSTLTTVRGRGASEAAGATRWHLSGAQIRRLMRIHKITIAAAASIFKIPQTQVRRRRLGGVTGELFCWEWALFLPAVTRWNNHTNQGGGTVNEGQPNAEQIAALQAFERKHGRTWKSALSLKWLDGTDAAEENGALLRQVRNQFGPEWLYAAGQLAVRGGSCAHVETAYDAEADRWGVRAGGKPVSGTFRYSTEMEALNRARHDFPDANVWITRDSCHSQNRPALSAFMQASPLAGSDVVFERDAQPARDPFL